MTEQQQPPPADPEVMIVIAQFGGGEIRMNIKQRRAVSAIELLGMIEVARHQVLKQMDAPPPPERTKSRLSVFSAAGPRVA